MIEKSGMHVIHNSLFLRFIMFSIEIWGNTYAANVNCLMLLQKRLYGYFVVLRNWTIHLGYCLSNTLPSSSLVTFHNNRNY